MHKRIYWHIYKSPKQIYNISRFHVLVYYHYPDGRIHVFFALNQRVLESTSGMKNSAFVNPCDNCFCVVFHVLKYKWSCFFQVFLSLSSTNHVSSCQSKNVLWWLEWSRLQENSDFYSHFEDELSTCFVHACLVYLIRFFICVEIA